MNEDLVKVRYNEEEVLSYNRGQPVPILQQSYLKRMDRKMEQGIVLRGRPLAHPRLMERAEFVADALAQALEREDDAMAAAMCTWLANRLPRLRGVNIRRDGDALTSELVMADAVVTH